jgi:hypothetical protein
MQETASVAAPAPDGGTLTLSQQCRQFADILGLDGPVTEKVLMTALENETYARNLLISKESPQLLKRLLDNPPKPRSSNQEFSSINLIGKAAGALLRWGSTGFTKAGPTMIERRETACLACPHLAEPQGVLQNIVPSAGLKEAAGYRTGKKVCGLCGCNVSNKIRLVSEHCPDIDADDNGLTRWGESRPAS